MEQHVKHFCFRAKHTEKSNIVGVHLRDKWSKLFIRVNFLLPFRLSIISSYFILSSSYQSITYNNDGVWTCLDDFLFLTQILINFFELQSSQNYLHVIYTSEHTHISHTHTPTIIYGEKKKKKAHLSLY